MQMIPLNHLRNRFLFAAFFFLFVSGQRIFAAAPPAVSAASAILVDAATGKILYEKNAHEKRPIASTTKIMTGLLAIEHCPPREMIRVDKEAVEVEGSRLGLAEGDEVEADLLFRALLLKSANDAAVALADHIGGSVRGFADMMNARAFELGARETHFCNPHGLHDPEHYSSAYDLALISREAMKERLFRRLVSTRSCTVRLPDGSDSPLVNHNRLLFEDENVDGIKTGYVKESGRCLAASAKREGWRLIAVVLDSTDLWKDAEGLLNYGFENWEATVFARADRPVAKARVIGGRGGEMPIFPAQDLVEVRKPGEKSLISSRVEIRRLLAPVREGQEVGRLRLFKEGQEVGTTALLAGESVPQAGWFALVRVMQKVLLAGVLVVAGLKAYGKTAKIARRRRRRLQAEG